MAKSGERRMLFDIRGRRKHVIRAVYAVLALLMGASLFLVVGPVNITGLIGGGSSSSAGTVLDEQAERIERRLAKSPKDAALLLSLTRARIAAGNARVEVDPETGGRSVTSEASAEYEVATAAWRRYLKQAGGEPSAGVALLVANTYFSLAQAATTLEGAVANVKGAAEAQRLVAAARPSVGTVTTMAIYEYFAGNFAGGDRAAKQAEKLASSKTQATQVKNQLAEYRKRGKEFEKQKRAAVKAARSKGKEVLQNPFGGLAGTGP